MILLFLINLWAVSADPGSFTLFPRNVTQVQGLEVEFLCRHSTAKHIVWSVNETDPSEHEDITQWHYQYTDGLEVYSLTVRAIPEYNGTIIRCHALFLNDTSPEQASEPATLLIQGTPSAVGDLMISVYQYGLSVVWTAPFTLIKDITYCIDVRNNSDRTLIISECGINATQYNLTVVDPTPCDSVSITVTPVNRAGNGTQQNIDGYFYNVPDDVPVGSITTYRSENTTLFSFAISYTPLCTCGLAVAMLNESVERIYNMDVVECDPRSVSVRGDLPNNHHYNLRLEILNTAGSGYLNVSISTHDIQDVDVSDISRNNTVFMRFRFTENSSSLGAFVILHVVRLYPDGSVQLNDSIYTTSSRHDNTASIIIHDVPIGIYNVLAYDIENNGLLSGSPLDEMTVASPALVHGPIAVLGSQRVKLNGTHTPNELQNVTIQPVQNATMININCTLHEAAPPGHGCIVVIQPTTNLYSQLIIEVLPRTSNEGALIDLPGEGWYHVRVYPWTSGGLLTSDMAWVEDIHATAIFDSSVMIMSTVSLAEDDSPVTMATNTQPANTMTFKWVSITLGAVVSVLVLLLLVAICMTITKGRKHRPKSPQAEETGLDLYEQVAEVIRQTEVIYDEPQTPPPQPENMQPCVAYEVSHR